MPNEPALSQSTGNPLQMIRGALAFSVAGFLLLVSDLLQRTVVAAAARLLPRARHRILTVWIQWMRFVVLDLATVMLGGARLAPRLRIPSRSDVLVIMNHQSILDIPLVVRSVEDGYPRIVTRRRYARGIPVISHMVRLYQYPVVDPKATVKGHLRGLTEASRNGDTPIAIFPEGSRTHTGELVPWKRAGLRVLLSQRQWDVYLVVADGLWRARSVPGFLRDVSRIDIRNAQLGPFRSPPPDGDLDGFMEEMRGRMETLLAELRKGGT